MRPENSNSHSNRGNGLAKRKLTTIFCADAVNYGAHMAGDEDGTLARLQEYRDIMNQQFSRYDGREINTWGDAVIAEFDSVVEAVRCAVEIQSALHSRNDLLPGNQQLMFRIGINLGDVIHQGDNIYGDGVNVASRLEALADPGGIMVSKSVYDFAARQLAVGFDFHGQHVAKKGELPVDAYRVRVAGDNQGPALEDDETSSKQRDGDRTVPPNLGDDARTLAGSLSALPSVSWWKNWFEAQPRMVRLSVLMVGFFFLINLLFSGIATPWFIFPSMPFLAYIWLRRGKTDPEQ